MRANAFLFLVSLAIGLGSIEAMLRFAGPDASYWYAVRYAYASPGALRQEAPGVPARAPNASLRHVAAYAVKGITVEYDYILRTNNLGFAQDRDLLCARPTVFVLGDSFTEGMGAAPWFGAIEDAADRLGTQIANLGYFGTGFLNWREMVAHYEGCLRPEKVLIVFISHDWFRSNFEFSEAQIACVDGVGPCLEPGHLFHSLPDSADMKWILARTLERHAARFGNSTWRDTLIRADVFLRSNSRAFTFLRQAVVGIFGLGEGMPSGERLAISQKAFADIVERFGRANVSLLWIPQADEAAAGRPNAHSRAVAELLSREGWQAARCDLELGDYLPYDKHPNEGGYAKIAQCVRDALLAP